MLREIMVPLALTDQPIRFDHTVLVEELKFEKDRSDSGVIRAGCRAARRRATARSGDCGGLAGATLDGSEKLRTELKIHAAPGGGYSAEMYSIDQSPDAFPVDSITLQGGTMTFALQQFQLNYEGKLSADGASIVQTLTQGKPLPLIFERATKATAWAIPNPHKVEFVEVEPRSTRRP